MGFNSVVVILNDRLGEIERDPEFGKKLADAIRSFDPSRRSEMPWITGQTQVIGCHHADGALVYVVGGNTGRYLGYGGSYRSTDKEIIKELERGRKPRMREKESTP